MNKLDIKSLLSLSELNTDITITGWVKNKRESKKIIFITINDGSTVNNLQVVIEVNNIDPDTLKAIQTGTSLEVKGALTKSMGTMQSVEIKATDIRILGEASPEEYPLQPKKHSLEFLRSKSHLRFRTQTFGAIFRIRSIISHAIHNFFYNKGFFYINSPIITSIDAEGAGSMFNVTSIDLNDIQNKTKDIYKDDFFDQRSYLTVSGQLAAEAAIFGLGKVYTFGPTFRAENSNTTRHLAEFWMVEPEMAFYNLENTIELIEEFIKYIIAFTLANAKDDLLFIDKNKEPDDNKESIIDKLTSVIKSKFEILEYSDAIKILEDVVIKDKGIFINEVSWGIDLASEHEKYLSEVYFKKPVFIKNYPADIKAFYMRLNDDNKTVAAVDLLFPYIGEVVGGSQREEREDLLHKAMQRKNMNLTKLDWYLETRKFGTVIHSGFGLGLERLVQFVTGTHNIRDVIPFPRTPGTLNF